MRLFDHLKPVAISLSALLAATGVMASDTSYYYSGKPWEVVLHLPDTQNERPYCAFRTSLWETRSISIEKMIGTGDEVAIALRIRKDAWQLPDNQTTTVAADTVMGMVEVPMKAITGQELYSGVPTVPVLLYNAVIGAMLDSVLAARQPQPLPIKFSGNEPVWTVPALDRFQAFEMNDASKRCALDLRGVQSKTEQDGSSQEVTSPFSTTLSTGQPPAQPSVSSQLPAAPSDWEFYARDEDWGPTCFAQTHRGIVMMGFMGSPGKDHLVGFVSSLFSGNTRATWHVDDKPAYVSEGSESDYFSWQEFGRLPMDLLDQMSAGKELAVTGAKGERVVLDLGGAAEAVSKFRTCVSKS
ncbi:hypothetical protein E0H65_14125 [Rhizobium leguminosarum bv. viciae]|nr:hypothetical protein E0H65_14125 [Rhizobium leguminosarum bv. viciae]